MNEEAVDALRNQIEEQAETIADLNEQVKYLTSHSGKALASAMRSYLSWCEQPPTSMDPAAYAEVKRRFRSEVEGMLREWSE